MSRTPSKRESMTSLSVIRDFVLRLNGERVDVCPTAQRLIGFLALQSGRSSRRAYVSGMLWMDSSEVKANASLRSAIWRSPDGPDGPVVGASNTHVWLNPDIDVDLHAATARARTMLDLPSVDLTTVDIDREVETFSDDVLLGWYDDWVIAERERFRQLRLHVLDQLGELLIRARHYSEAVQVGLVAVSSEPLRESAQRLLVRAHLCEGNLAEALRQYHSYADLLGRELGVRPSKAMESLVADALTAAAAPPWSGHARHHVDSSPSASA